VDLLTLQQPSVKGNKPPPNTTLSRTYSNDAIPTRAQSPISTSPLARSSSGHIANWAVERKQNLFDRKNGKDLNSNNNSTYGFSMTNLLGNGNEDVSVLKAELLELKAQNKIDQQLITAISSNEMIQYIQQLESENSELHDRVREVHTELRALKVANIIMVKKTHLTLK